MEIIESPQTDSHVGEKGFGVCKSCGKKTIGKTNDLCSRCGGTNVAVLMGHPEMGDMFASKQEGWGKARWGYPAPKEALKNGHCPKCHAEIVSVGAWACPKCGKF